MASLIVCGVAGASLSQVDVATSYLWNNTLQTAPSMGKPATLIGIVAALLSAPVCFIVALVRLRQIRHPHIADSETHSMANGVSRVQKLVGPHGAHQKCNLAILSEGRWVPYACIDVCHEHLSCICITYK